MKTLVMKFGGAAVATPEHFSAIADLILNRLKEYPRIAIVVSAMANTTDELISLAKKVHPEPPRREYDMLVSVGERISISLLAMALAAKKHEAVSFTGSQSGILTCINHSDARIVDVRPHRLFPFLDQGKTVIVAGFQGVSRSGDITTLGRGGSDTTAVALGIALGASHVEFYKDVLGVYDRDPKLHPDASLLKEMTFESALKIANQGAKVLHPRCIMLAEKNNLPLHVLSFHNAHSEYYVGTLIRDDQKPKSSEKKYEEEP